MDDEYMRTHPCPYATVEDLQRRRRRLRGLAHCGNAAIDKPSDAAWVARWNRLYAEGQKDPKKAAPPPEPKKVRKPRKKAPPPEPVVEEPEYRIMDHFDELFPDED